MKGKVKNMTDIRTIIHRLRMGQSIRLINKELGVHRIIIRELNDLAITHQWLNPELPMPSDEEISKQWDQKSKKTRSHLLDVYKEDIERWSKAGYSSVVIHQLLQGKCSCDVQSIRRYRKKHFPKLIEPVMVRPTVPGRDMDVDFGELGRFQDEDTIKRVWLFSLSLRHSRKVYREIVLDQTTRTFIMGHIHAFEYFNGVSENCIPDNLKAAVISPTIDNDEINRSYLELAEHYGFVISPCLPRTPAHKGGVEGDVKYVKRNFLPWFLETQKAMGIKIPKISNLRESLEKWNREVADIRIIHGVGRSPLELFKSEEEKALKPLPSTRWEPTSWSQCVVRRDWRIMIDYAYYSVPYGFIGKTVEVCITYSLVRIFYDHKEIALHEKATKKWEYKRKTEHAPPFEEAVLQSTREGLLTLASDIGIFTHRLTEAILSNPAVDKLKPIRHLLRLADKYSKERLEKACQRAFNFKMYSYSSVKNILEKNLESKPLDTKKEEKVIKFPVHRFARDPADYKSTYKNSETFEEKLARLHPFSKHGNAMMGGVNGLLADQIIEEDKRKAEKGDD